MLVTVITDASLSRGIGGWAGAIIASGRRATYSGRLKGEIVCINMAEVAAVANTLYSGLRDGLIAAGDHVILQVDNLWACNAIAAGSAPPRSTKNLGRKERARRRRQQRRGTADLDAARARVVNYVSSLLVDHRLTIDVRHIKAHLKLKDREARNHVHERIDRLANAARLAESREAR